MLIPPRPTQPLAQDALNTPVKGWEAPPAGGPPHFSRQTPPMKPSHVVGAAQPRTEVRTKGLGGGGTSEDHLPNNCLPDGLKLCWLDVGLWGTTVSVQTPTWHSAQRWVHRPIMVADSWLLGPLPGSPLQGSTQAGSCQRPWWARWYSWWAVSWYSQTHPRKCPLPSAPRPHPVSPGKQGGGGGYTPCAELGMEVTMNTSLPSWMSEGPMDLAGRMTGR